MIKCVRTVLLRLLLDESESFLKPGSLLRCLLFLSGKPMSDMQVNVSPTSQGHVSVGRELDFFSILFFWTELLDNGELT